MRISTNQIYESGALGIQRNQSNLYKLQNQLSSGRRVLTPSDDPVASAQALVVTQAKEINAQHLENQDSARSQLGILDGNLSSLTDILQAVHERAVESKNSGYSDNERSFVAKELQDRLSSIIGLANADDGMGQYLFSGYQGATKPFAIDGSLPPVAPATVPPVAYYGDDGDRLLQVGPSRQMPTNVSGSDLFMNIRGGNGSFVTATAGNSGGGNNQGSGVIDGGSVNNPAQWASAVNTYGNLRIEFSNGGSGLQYQIYDQSNNALLATPASFVAGQAIPLQKTTVPAANFGAQVVISGTPAVGDQFSVKASTSQSLFQTMQNLISVISTPVNASYSTTELGNRIDVELRNLDQALNNLATVRADVGSRQKELDFLTSGGEDQKVQYATTLSGLQDLDYTAAISTYSYQQIQLQAAQKSFSQISQLSLFNIL